MAVYSHYAKFIVNRYFALREYFTRRRAEIRAMMPGMSDEQPNTVLLAAAILLSVGCAVALAGSPPPPSDAWFCTRMINNKAYVTHYQVNGDIVVINGGRGHSEILENTPDRLISYFGFLTDMHRYPKNAPPVVVSEPVFIYMILEKSSGRLTELDSATSSVDADSDGRLMAPSVQTQDCQRERAGD